MAEYTLFASRTCGHCLAVLSFLAQSGNLRRVDVRYTEDPANMKLLEQLSARMRGIPQTPIPVSTGFTAGVGFAAEGSGTGVPTAPVAAFAPQVPTLVKPGTTLRLVGDAPIIGYLRSHP